MIFESEALYDHHLREDVNRCQVQPKLVIDGITPETDVNEQRRMK